MIQGPSGSGKTTLFRVLAGLWPYGRGTIGCRRMPVPFLPQKPYLPVGTLREALCFPERPDAYGLIEIGEALRATGLEHLADRLDEERSWSPILSPGEQRLAVARALLLRPDWLFLDEATSALDAAMEARLYKLLRARLPETAIVSIAHNPSVVAFHDRRLVIDRRRGACAASRWRWPAEVEARGSSLGHQTAHPAADQEGHIAQHRGRAKPPGAAR